MRPVNQVPLSLNEMKRSPFASSRSPDSPPKPGNGDVSTRPLRYCSEPNRRCERSRMSNEAIGRALTSIATGAANAAGSGGSGLAGGWIADCPDAMPGTAAKETAAADWSKRRRGRSGPMGEVKKLRMQLAGAAGSRRGAVGLAEQFGQFLGDGAAEFF